MVTRFTFADTTVGTQPPDWSGAYLWDRLGSEVRMGYVTLVSVRLG
jgi:hypothetical protein